MGPFLIEYSYIITEKSSKKFHCEKCNYSTSRKSQYDRHLRTDKHKTLQNSTLNKSEPKWSCLCGKNYKHSSTLYAHRRNCIIENTPKLNNASEQTQIINKQIIETLLKIVQNGNIN